ncbi:hypothetical protein CASFOL_006365 [Castilleja foliolosa]|uniref:Uncharacterized protein n=1 Tax=Castilleja foliolosa TaxID=1961234 RepID=A0ABD3E6R2_9LAMI
MESSNPELEPSAVSGNGAETGQIIVTAIAGRNGQPKQNGVEDDGNAVKEVKKGNNLCIN